MSSPDSLPPRTGGRAKSESRPDAPPKKPGPSLARRLISWIFILILLGVVIFEWRAKTNYTSSLQALQARHREEDAKGVELKFPEAETLLRGSPVKAATPRRSDDVVEYRWKSLFRKYVIFLVVEKGTNSVLDIQTEQPE